ncbi:DUF5362 family protein [Saprospiraceae bacterium]|nr:DUF5362 family protein [Saprospiraceae bacterium]
MNELLDDSVPSDSLVLSQDVKSYLLETAKWSKLLSIVGFVMIALIVIGSILAGVFMGSIMSAASQEFGGAGAMFGGGFITFMYMIIGLIYFFPIMYLYKFSTKMKTAIANNNQVQLSESFKNLKSCYKFMGILTLIIVILYGAIFVFALIGGAAGFLLSN